MAKRFTDSDKWKDRWFRSLSPSFKLAWLYLLDNCDQAGVIELDEQLADFQIGQQVDWKAFIDACGDRIRDLENGKLFVLKFIGFQYGTKLSANCKAHNPVFQSLEKHSLSIPFPKGIERVHSKSPGQGKGQGQGNSQSQASKSEPISEDDTERRRGKKVKNQPFDCSNLFKEWYSIYPRKEAPKKAEAAYAKALEEISKTEGIDCSQAAQLLLDWTKERITMLQSQLKPEGDFRPHPASWLNAGRYRDGAAAASQPIARVLPETKVGNYEQKPKQRWAPA